MRLKINRVVALVAEIRVATVWTGTVEKVMQGASNPSFILVVSHTSVTEMRLDLFIYSGRSKRLIIICNSRFFTSAEGLQSVAQV